MSNADDAREMLELVKRCASGHGRDAVDVLCDLDRATLIGYASGLASIHAGHLLAITGSEQAAVEYLSAQQDEYRE
ncbi:hypothetical protein [uncultured Dermacoccus sp.]|uniref:hypothetical protein n=1 Tax=uncultured Dermacoccus sp. TaxID=339343 RepID=UPI002596D28A|nr:hypothetical protein [uncultured Dermacoccus sp.]